MRKGSSWRMREEVSSSALLLGFGLLLLVAAISTYLSWETSFRSAQARGASEIRVASLELLNAVRSEETAAREVLVTVDDASPAAHDRSEESLRGKFANLVALTERAGRHAEAVKTIEDKLAARTARFKGVVQDRRSLGLDAAFSEEFHNVSDASLGEIGGLLRQIANTEMISLVQSLSETEAGRWWLTAGSVTSFVLAGLLCFAALFLLRRRVNLLKASERVLSAFNAQLEMSVRQRTHELEGAKAESQR